MDVCLAMEARQRKDCYSIVVVRKKVLGLKLRSYEEQVVDVTRH